VTQYRVHISFKGTSELFAEYLPTIDDIEEV